MTRAQLQLAAGEVSKAEFDPQTGRVTVEARLLDTPSGQLVQHALQRGRSQIEAGLALSQPLAVSVAATGTLKDDTVVEAVGPVLSVVEAEDIEPR